MIVHGRNGWTAQARTEIAVSLLSEIGKLTTIRFSGRNNQIRVHAQMARDVLVLNGELLDKKVEYYRPWMRRNRD